MSVALHFPERRGFARWTLSAAAIIAAHAIVVGALALWYTRAPPQEDIIPAIAVSLVPVPSSAPQVENQDVAVGPPMVQQEQTPPETPKVEEEKPVERIETPPPPPQQHAEVTLPRPPHRPAEKPKPQKPPVPETRAPPKIERTGQFSQAASNSYNSLVYGHLQQFKRYPDAAGNASGIVNVSFVLNRSGNVVASHIVKSSGNSVLDQEALAILRRASPFPAFPAEKPGSQDSFVGPINFSR
jgi:protein TonB